MRARPPTKPDLYLAVWMHAVQSDCLIRGHLTKQGLLELNEAIAVQCRAARLGLRIPTMGEACDYYNNG